MLEDTYLEKGLRNKMVDEIQHMGINDTNVLEALRAVPRHFFFENSLQEYAYKNKAFSIASNQTISQPYTVAFQTSLLKVNPFQKILEIGTGSGYQACLLAFMKANVFSLERQKKLFLLAKQSTYISTFHNIKIFYGDGHKGLKQFAPFDRILITAAASKIPYDLLLQLKVGGIMVLPLCKDGESSQEMISILKISENKHEITEHGKFTFVPMLKGLEE